MNVWAVIITNGRSTFPHALKLLEAQTLQVPIVTIKNRGWIEANNDAIRSCDGLMLRVDDDIFLHPRALEFLVNTWSGSICHMGKLYEHFTRRVAGAVKIYNAEVVVNMGGFRPNKLGKIDRTFEADCKKRGYEITCPDKVGPIGLHACAPWDEQLEYEKLWGYKKSTRNEMRKYDVPVEVQAAKVTKWVESYNGRRKTKFWKWLNA